MEAQNDKPPPASPIRYTTPGRIRSGVGIGGSARLRAMVAIRHLPNPNLSSGLRNDNFILDSFRQRD